MGGGQGGSNGEYSGGDSGYVFVGEIGVQPRSIVAIAVGSGGVGGKQDISVSNGTVSSFGAFAYSSGFGGSGGGQGCDASDAQSVCASGSGGSDGSNGGLRTGSGTWGSGARTGQGSFSARLLLFTRNRLSAGAGGSGAVGCSVGGGGGGGVLFNGNGPINSTPAQNGQVNPSGRGGVGFGAGGGAGGRPTIQSTQRNGGGRGADGLVYIEW